MAPKYDHIIIPCGDPCSPEQKARQERALMASFRQTAEIYNGALDELRERLVSAAVREVIAERH